jgi:hypothetical protein
VGQVGNLPPRAAADWPGWRGANRDGKSADTGLLDEWPDGGPKLLWKTDIVGEGYGSMAVAGGMVYTSGVVKGHITVKGSRESWAHPVVAHGRLYLRYDKNLYCFDVKAG